MGDLRRLASKTAEAAALGRAIESNRAARDRLFHDPLARGFLRWERRAAVTLMRLPGVAAALLSIRDRQLPGVRGNLLCRTRYIDDALLAALRDGVEQVVLLGAGFDSRAYRLPEMRRAQVFEVDRATMLAVKQARLKWMLDEPPQHVSFVAADFARDRIGDVMRAAGFKTETPTIFICEGVTQYVGAAAVEDLLRFVAATAVGSRLAFTYIHRAVVEGLTCCDADRRVLDFVRCRGEPWTFGLDPAALAGFLADRGFTVLDHVGADDYRTRYLRPIGRRLELYESERVVVAEVNGRAIARGIQGID
jgi:methyltransferase (TIGR00027 family)